MAALKKVETQTAAPEQSAAEVKVAKEHTVYTTVKMDDGREVKFAGKRQLLKNSHVENGKVHVLFDFVNGKSLKFTAPEKLMHQLAAHGAKQKIGDVMDGKATLDDNILALEDEIKRLHEGEWTAERVAGDSMSGASIVIRAIVEASGLGGKTPKTVDWVKEFLSKKLDVAKAKGEKLSRSDLYASFRRPGTDVAKIIARLEAEAAKKEAEKATGPTGAELLQEMGI